MDDDQSKVRYEAKYEKQQLMDSKIRVGDDIKALPGNGIPFALQPVDKTGRKTEEQ